MNGVAYVLPQGYSQYCKALLVTAERTDPRMQVHFLVTLPEWAQDMQLRAVAHKTQISELHVRSCNAGIGAACPAHICTGTRPIAVPHLPRDWAYSRPTSAPGLGSL